MKRFFTGLSIAFLLSTSVATSTHATYFEGASSWATSFLESALSNDLIPVTLQSNYTQAITRAEFCSLAVATYERSVGYEIGDRSYFSDTVDENVQKMAALGVVTGTSETEFSPHRLLTREEAAVMLSTLIDKLGFGASEEGLSFGDTSDIAFWAAPSVSRVQQAGVMTGNSDNKFDPKGNYTREQSVITLLQVFELVGTDASNTDITSITLSHESAFLSVGESIHLSAISNFGGNLDEVVWTSTSPDVISVMDGVVTMNRLGQLAKVTATTKDGLSAFCMILGKSEAAPTTTTTFGNMYGRFQAIPAIENISPNIISWNEHKYSTTYSSHKDVYFYNYQTYYMEEGEMIASRYSDYLQTKGFVLTFKGENPIIKTDTGSNMLYELTSPCGKYEVSVHASHKNTELHLSGAVSVCIDYSGGELGSEYYRIAFNEASSLWGDLSEPEASQPEPSAPTEPESEGMSEDEVFAILNPLLDEYLDYHIAGLTKLRASLVSTLESLDSAYGFSEWHYSEAIRLFTEAREEFEKAQLTAERMAAISYEGSTVAPNLVYLGASFEEIAYDWGALLYNNPVPIYTKYNYFDLLPSFNQEADAIYEKVVSALT